MIKSILNINSLIKQQLHLLSSDDKMKDIFPRHSIATVYKPGRNLKEMITPSLYSRPKHTSKSRISSCRSCDICKSFFRSSNTYTYAVTKWRYFVKEELNYNTNNVIYLIFFKFYFEQYVR